jgi:hypothetical protein
MSRDVRNVPASVRERLMTVAEARGIPFNRVLDLYGLERLLFRLSLSEHRDSFVLKGAMLFVAWPGTEDRPTRDMDLLGYGSPEPADVAARFGDECRQAVPVDDGMEFLTESITAETIRRRDHRNDLRDRGTPGALGPPTAAQPEHRRALLLCGRRS